jgi:hypothetical protein
MKFVPLQIQQKIVFFDKLAYFQQNKFEKEKLNEKIFFDSNRFVFCVCG